MLDPTIGVIVKWGAIAFLALAAIGGFFVVRDFLKSRKSFYQKQASDFIEMVEKESKDAIEKTRAALKSESDAALAEHFNRLAAEGKKEKGTT